MKKYILLLLIFTSCDIQKQATKQKNDIDSSEWSKTQTFRKGDTVTYIVPVVRYKDTVINTVSTQGTILRTYYNDKGEISKSDCISAEIAQIQETLKSITDNSVNKTNEKTEGIGLQLIPYIFAFLCFAFITLVIAAFLYFKK
jgi:hypothetical protein